LDGEVAAGALGVVCPVVLFVALLFWELLWVLLWANALLAVDGSSNRAPPNRTPPNTTLDSSIGRNFIKTLFPAWRSRPRALAIRALPLLRVRPSSARSGALAYTSK
jgi:hypothetical protein